MPDNFTANPGSGGDTFAADDVAGVKYPYSKLDIGGDGVSSPVTSANPLPVALPAAQIATLTPLSTVAVSNMVAQGLTDTQLRASPVPVSGTVSTGLTQPLTDTQLRATPVPVSGTVSTGLSQPLTDAQLRASNVATRINAYNYPISTANSSTTQLTAGASFTGGIESLQDLPSISILLTSDQPITLTVRQFIDAGGTFAAPDIVFYVRAGAGFSRSLAINGNFVRIIATNTGASTTTTFNLNVAFGTLGDSDSTGTLPVTELPLVLTGQAAQTAVINNILTPTAGANALEVSNYRAASVQVVSTGTAGTFIFEQSNDNVNWRRLPVFNAELVTAVPITAAITATASQIIYTFPLRCNFVRLRIATTITGGSIQAFSRFSTEPWTAAAQLVASNTAANLLAQVSGSVTADTEFAAAAALADGFANPTTASGGALLSQFNGTTWDRARGNTAVSVEASSAKTASGNSASAITNHSARGVQLFINVSAVSGTTPTLAVRVQVQDPVGLGWVDLPGAVTASITGVSLTLLTIYPGVTVAANSAISAPLPRTWRLAWTIGGTTPSFTFSVGAQYIL